MITLHQIHNSFFSELTSFYPKSELKAIWNACYQFILECKPNELITNPNSEITGQKLIKINQAIQRLKKNEPVQYITGKTWFCEQLFEVNPSVLIPRPETEELVYFICEHLTHTPKTLMDIGTGSGCIAISIKHLKPLTNVIAVDVSEEALNTATNNAIQILGATSTSFINRDILSPDFATIFKTKFDIIVSNPPYIPIIEKESMERNVLDYEPHLALFCDNNPLMFYDAIAKHAKQLLTPDGLLFFEIHHQYSKSIMDLLANLGYKNTLCVKDMQGKDRIIKTQLKHD